jgi:hypothetical protein
LPPAATNGRTQAREPQRNKAKCRFAATTQPRRDEIRIVSGRAAPQPRPNRFHLSPTAATKGPLPAPKKTPVAIGASAPIHPRVGQSGPPRFKTGGCGFSRRPAGRMTWRQEGRMTWRCVARRPGDAAAGTAHWPTAGIGLELTTAEAPAPVPGHPCAAAMPCRASARAAEPELARETHAARDHHHR